MWAPALGGEQARQALPPGGGGAARVVSRRAPSPVPAARSGSTAHPGLSALMPLAPRPAHQSRAGPPPRSATTACRPASAASAPAAARPPDSTGTHLAAPPQTAGRLQGRAGRGGRVCCGGCTTTCGWHGRLRPAESPSSGALLQQCAASLASPVPQKRSPSTGGWPLRPTRRRSRPMATSQARPLVPGGTGTDTTTSARVCVQE